MTMSGILRWAVLVAFGAVLMASSEAMAVGEASADELAEKLSSERLPERIAAAKALAERSPEIDAALKPLGDALRDEYWAVRHHAMAALVEADEKAVPVLIDALGREDFYSRWYAARALKRIGPAAAPAAEALGDALRYGGVDVKVEAARAALAAGQSEKVSDGLLVALEHRNPTVRDAAAEAIAEAGTKVIPGLTRLLSHSRREVRLAAADALAGFGPEAAPAADELVDALKKECKVSWEKYGGIDSVAIRYSRMRDVIGSNTVARALERIGEPAAEPLAEALRSGQGGMARWACRILRGARGEALAPVIEPLLPYWKAEADESWAWGSLRNDIAGVFRAAGRYAKPAIPAMIDGLSSDDARMRKECAVILGRIGSEAEKAVQPLEKLTSDENEDVQKAARQAMKSIREG
ncbi:MAG: HEAT repeat domain-containing protein [Planctomycetota bacterium]